MTLSLIIINFLIFFFQFSSRRITGEFMAFAAVPYEITHYKDIPPYINLPIYSTLFTAMFLHGGFFHILGNMLYLWIFGDNVEDAMGTFRFLIFYLLCGLIATLSHIAMQPNSKTPMIGASGAISGVLGAYLLLFPRAKILTLIVIFYFIEIIKLPAVIVLSFWILIQLIGSRGPLPSGIAWFAHIGGFFAGVFLVSVFKKKNIRLGIVSSKR